MCNAKQNDAFILIVNGSSRYNYVTNPFIFILCSLFVHYNSPQSIPDT